MSDRQVINGMVYKIRTGMAGTEGSGFHPAFVSTVESGAVDAIFYKGAYAAAYSGFEGAAEDGTGLAA